MLPKVTQSFKLQRSDLKVVGLNLRSDCLLLSIIVLYENMQPFERLSRNVCTKNKVSCSFVAQNVD